MSWRSSARRGPLALLSLLAGWVLVGLVLLAGCGGSDPAPPQPTSHPGTLATPGTASGSGSPSADTATATPASWPQVPAKAKAHTARGAEAFARYYFTAMNYAWTRPDPTIFTAIALPSCKSCANDQAFAADLLSKHRRFASAPGRIVATNPNFGSGGRSSVSVVWRSAGLKIVDGANHTVEREDPTSAVFEAAVKWTDDGWRIEKVYVTQRGK
jgi:Family of unknown function (DUF6318)